MIKSNDSKNHGYGLVVYNGSATISGVSGSTIALKDDTIAPTNLKSITANGITVTGKNQFSGDIQLVSYGSVSTPLTGPAVGINIQNGASITTTGSLSLEQRNKVSTTAGRAYGILIDHATLTVGKDLTLSNYGNVSSSDGKAHGIYVQGNTTGQVSLSAGGDLRMNSVGTISSTSDSAYGIMIDASSGGKAYLSAGNDMIFGVNGTIYTTNADASAYGVMMNGVSSSEFKLSAGKDMLVAQHAAITSKYSNGYGIYVGGTATLNAKNDLNFLQNGAIFGSMGTYGIKVDGKGGVATLNANNDINFTQGGAITGSGATYGILVDGKGGVATLNANNDINFTQGGAITGSGATYGILVDGGTANSSAALTAIHDIKFTQNGAISATGQNGNAYGISVNGSGGTAKLNANNDINFTQGGAISGSGATYGILVDGKGGVATLNANNDINFTQGGAITGSGVTYGILVDGSTAKSSAALTAIHDIKFTQNGAISATGQNGNAYGISVNGSGGTAKLNAKHDLNFLQKGLISGSMGTYGIKVDGKGGVATLNANNDINFTQGGAITGSGVTYGILVDGSTAKSSAAVTAIHDIKFTQNGAISATGQNGNAYGISIEAINGGKAVLKTIGHNIILTQNGLVDSVAGDAISLHINGMTSRDANPLPINEMTSGMASLDSGNDVIITSNNSSRSHAGLKNSLGIYLYDAKVKAKNDIVIDQIGDSQSDRGGSFGLLIYNTTRPQSPDYSLYAIRDVRFTENGIVKASGKFNYAVGVVAENARIVAGRNVVGYQGGDVFQNYNGEAAGFHITGSEINAGNPDNINQAASGDNADNLKPGSIYLGQSGNINDVSPTPALTNDAENQRAPASKLTVDTGTRRSFVKTTIDVPHLPVPNTKGVAYGVYLDSSQFFATKDITINQTGILHDVQQINGGDYKAAADGKYGIYLASSGTDANTTLTLSAGSEDGTINLTSDGNNVALALVSDKTPNKRGIWSQLPGSFTAKAGSLHIDLGGGNFNAGTQMLDATSVGNLIIALPKGDAYNPTTNITGGKSFFYTDPTLDEITPIAVAINMGKTGKALTFLAPRFYANEIDSTVDNVGVKSKGTVTINAAPPAASAGSQTLSWIEGKNILVSKSASFGDNITLVASGDLTKVANASNIGGVKTPDIYAGIYVANGASLSTSTGKNLTLIQNGSFAATANANAYGVYVENGGRIGNSANAGNLSIQQIGAITATGTGNAAGVYVAGTVAQGGDVTIDQIGKISAGDKGSATGVNLISDVLPPMPGRDLIIGKDLNLTGDFTANAGGDYNINKSVSANKVTLNVGGSTTIKDSATVTTKNFDAQRIGIDFTQNGKIVGNGSPSVLPTISINAGRDLTLANDVSAASLTLTAGRKVTVDNEVTAAQFQASATKGDVTTKAKITSNTSFSATTTEGNVVLDGQVIADKFTASAGGNVTAINPGNQIKNLGDLKGDTRKKLPPLILSRMNNMNRDETDMIENLFSRLAAADTSEKDKEALNLINAKISANPNAAYLLVQTVLIQEAALKSWQERAQQLESENAASKIMAEIFCPRRQMPQMIRRGLLCGGVRFKPLIAANRVKPIRPIRDLARAQPIRPIMARTEGLMAVTAMADLWAAAGGFMRSALTTAAGVAGGMLLYNGISNMFSSGSSASEAGIQNSANETGAGESANNYDQVNDSGSGVDHAGGGADYSQAGYDGGGYGNDFGGDSGGFDSGKKNRPKFSQGWTSNKAMGTTGEPKYPLTKPRLMST
eukprot:Em0263g7a